MIKDLQYVRPETEGLSVDNILLFLKEIKRRKINLHSLMIARRGKILFEGYYKPFDENFRHRIYSSSKSVVALAVGKLAGEGRVKLEDKIADYFPEYKNDVKDEGIAACTVKDALMMSVSIPYDSYLPLEKDTADWTKSFFTRYNSVKPAGTIFHYNTSGTFILDVLVEKLTGKTFLEYLRPEFDEIGVSRDVTCVLSPDGHAWGGSGVMLTLRDFAKIGELILNKGAAGGKQILPRWYMEEMTSVRIANLDDNECSGLGNYGYGYQLWITESGYATYGMGSQMVYCFPDKEFMVVCQGDTQRACDTAPKDIYWLVSDILYSALKENALPKDDESFSELERVKENLELEKDFGKNHSPFEEELSGKEYVLSENPMGWKRFRFDFCGEQGTLTYENARGVKEITFGLGNFIKGTFPETHYYDLQVNKPSMREPDALFIANFTEEKKLLLRNYITDTNFGNCFMTFGFKGKEVGLLFNKRAEFFMDDYCGFAAGKIKE